MDGTMMTHTLGAKDHTPELTEVARQLSTLPSIETARMHLKTTYSQYMYIQYIHHSTAHVNTTFLKSYTYYTKIHVMTKV